MKEGFAYFCLNEYFHGLPVYELMIPAETFDIHAIFIDMPINKARKIALKKFGSEYRKSQLSDEGEEPVLLMDPKNSSKSVLTCNERSQ